MLKAISALILAAHLLFPVAPVGVGRSDAYARASGDAKSIAIVVGRALFRTQWPAQVLNVYADSAGAHSVAGLRISAEKFHHPLTRAEFLDEIAAIAQRTFGASTVDEVDIWATQPVRVRKGAVVTGDKAIPAWRTVFTVSIERSESAASLARRLRHGLGVYWNQDWARSALE